MTRTYVAYDDEEVIAIGTKQEVADQLGVSESTVAWYATPSQKERKRVIVAVDLDERDI